MREETKILLASWQTRGGASYVRLFHRGGFEYMYEASNGSGYIVAEDRQEAIAYMETRVQDFASGDAKMHRAY